MSTATQDLRTALIKSYTVVAGGSATLGYPAIFSGADDVVDDGGIASDLIIGIFLDTAVAGARARVALFGPIARVVVGTGGATRGTKAVMVADGFTDAPAHDSSGATNNQIYGIFMNSGVATARVGMQLVPSNRGSA